MATYDRSKEKQRERPADVSVLYIEACVDGLYTMGKGGRGEGTKKRMTAMHLAARVHNRTRIPYAPTLFLALAATSPIPAQEELPFAGPSVSARGFKSFSSKTKDS